MDIVLGAGIVGVCTAIYLRQAGREVVLIDKNGVGNETSFGNAGLIERTDLLPRSFPREFKQIIHYAKNRDNRVRYDFLSLFALSPWLMRYWHYSNEQNIMKISQKITPLFKHCLSEHEYLLEQAGIKELLKYNGWLHLSRKRSEFSNIEKNYQIALSANLRARILTSDEVANFEPALKEKFAWGVHWQDSAFIIDPGQYVKELAKYFVANGGQILTGDAKGLEQVNNHWQIATNEGKKIADNIVIALGAWSGEIIKKFGYNPPLAIKRGYHKNYHYETGERLKIPIIDADNGFVLAPMKNGIRLTSGIEFALLGKKPTPIQLKNIEPIARRIIKMGKATEDKAWLGNRPCCADMMPIVGAAPNHKGLWFNFAHAHHGLTLAPICGKILAQKMMGERPLIDIEPFSIDRFGRGRPGGGG